MALKISKHERFALREIVGFVWSGVGTLKHWTGWSVCVKDPGWQSVSNSEDNNPNLKQEECSLLFGGESLPQVEEFKYYWFFMSESWSGSGTRLVWILVKSFCRHDELGGDLRAEPAIYIQVLGSRFPSWTCCRCKLTIDESKERNGLKNE